MDKAVKAEKARIAAILKEKKGETTYYRIAKLSGLSITQVKSIEKGKAYTIDSLIRVCEALNCKLDIK